MIRAEGAAPIIKDGSAYPYQSWTGALREYDARTHQWFLFAPLWHTAQAAKAILIAQQWNALDEFRPAVQTMIDFVMNGAVRENQAETEGLLRGHEGDSTWCNTSCALEALDGLMVYESLSSDPRAAKIIDQSLSWISRKAYLAGKGLFLDNYNPVTGECTSLDWTLRCGHPGRPLLDGAVFLRQAIRTGDPCYETIFLETAGRLLKEENPPGNWIQFPPCHAEKGIIHPRHAYWWGEPMVAAWQRTGDDRFLACARRAADWYVKAIRLDGGLFRATSLDFRTPSFGQEMSGALAAACLWLSLCEAGKGDEYAESICLVLRFARELQFLTTEDSNLRGAILETIHPPDGTDRPPFAIRDLGTIFYVQALSRALHLRLLS